MNAGEEERAGNLVQFFWNHVLLKSSLFIQSFFRGETSSLDSYQFEQSDMSIHSTYEQSEYSLCVGQEW